MAIIRIFGVFLFAIGFSEISRAQVSIGQITGSFFVADAKVTPAPFITGYNVSTGDLNGDGVSDAVLNNAGFAIGPNPGAFRTLLMNEDASSYGWSQSGMGVPPNLQGYRAAVTADFNNDGKDDVATLSHMMSLSVMLNQGQNKTITGFPTSTNIDLYSAIGWVYTNSITDRVVMIPVFRADDFDGDGNKDIIMAFNMIHYWQQDFTSPGIIFLWGRGDGTFETPQVVPVATSFGAVDAEFVDWNGDGVKDTLLYLEQSIAFAQFYTTQLSVFQFLGVAKRNITQVSNSGWLGPITVNALEYVAPQSTPYGPTSRMIVMSGHSFPASYEMTPKLYVSAIDNNFNVVGSVNEFPLPVGTAGVDSDLQSVRAADFDKDGDMDLVALHQREYVSGFPLPEAQLVYVEGPITEYGTFNAQGFMNLTGVMSATLNFPLRTAPGALAVFHPNKSYPEMIQLADFNSDNTFDLFVGGVFVPVNPSNSSAGTYASVVSVMNYSTFGQYGYSRIDRIPGTGTASAGGIVPRCGISNGKPKVGNTQLKITLKDAPANGIASLLGSNSLSLWTYNGLNLALIPEAYSQLFMLSGGSTAAPSSGAAEYTISVPNDPALVGQTVFFQWIVGDSGSSAAFPFSCSAGIGVTVGN
jgi:hypothetical protein